MGFPTDFFPLLFAIPRIAGWLAHWKEQLDREDLKIWRPRQIYVGKEKRPYVPLNERDPNNDKRVIRSDSKAMYKRYTISLQESKSKE